mmetsp:Transcript_184832/g.586342  ORF Transcript_184832/g.586342 Transcript_184832/m.586342 type:complete len:214 (+) Transcript_184832:297-938(+)
MTSPGKGSKSSMETSVSKSIKSSIWCGESLGSAWLADAASATNCSKINSWASGSESKPSNTSIAYVLKVENATACPLGSRFLRKTSLYFARTSAVSTSGPWCKRAIFSLSEISSSSSNKPFPLRSCTLKSCSVNSSIRFWQASLVGTGGAFLPCRRRPPLLLREASRDAGSIQHRISCASRALQVDMHCCKGDLRRVAPISAHNKKSLSRAWP